MFIKAYAKVNLGLDIIGKREDGYHLLKMIMQTVDLYDEIEINKSDDNKISIKCNISYVPVDNRNLMYKAAVLFMDKYNINSGLKINIKKNIPVAAGMAGGSTDAAAVLKCLNKLFEVNAPYEELADLALKIGADVPYCINGGTAICEGIGEVITELPPFKNVIMVIVKPSFGVSTKEVYGALDISRIKKHVKIDNIVHGMKKNNINIVCYNMKNVLENVTIRKYPVIKDIKHMMIKQGAKGALMSGSGPTVFGIFSDMMSAQRCFENMKKKYKDVFITRTI